MIDALPPGLILIVAGLLIPLMPGISRPALILIAPISTLAQVWALPEGSNLVITYLGWELAPATSDALGRIFATVFALMAFGGGLFALNQRSNLELAAAFCYAGGAIGVTFAGDLLTFFGFWEFMAVASTLVVMAAGPAARAAAMRYAVIHFVAGVLLFAGIAGHVVATGSIALTALQADSVATWLILLGILLNAAAFPISAWLPDAYPSASWSGMVFLSAFTT